MVFHTIINLIFFHFYKVLALAIILLVLFLIIRIHKFAIFQSLHFTKEKFTQCQVIFINHKGAYQNLGSSFAKIHEDCCHTFKISKIFAIFYDDPESLKDRYLARSTLGLIINEGELFKLSTFLKTNTTYKLGSLPTSQCIHTSYPFINLFSLKIIAKKVYPSLRKYLREYGIEKKVLVEVFNFVPKENKTVEFYVPYQSEGFMLWHELKSE